MTAALAAAKVVVWFPKLLAAPHDHFNWAGNAISIALSGAPWVVADSICRAAKRAPTHTESAQVSTPA